jgi:putative transposase
VPQRRGKLERLFGTVNTELLPGLPGQLAPGSSRPVIPPSLSLAQLDERLGRLLVDVYNQRVHSHGPICRRQRPREHSRSRDQPAPHRSATR